MTHNHPDPINFGEATKSIRSYWTLGNQILKFDAKVVSLEEGLLELDKMHFYPEGGGQPGDQGYLLHDGIETKVLDTIESDGKILLRTSNPLPVGAHVTAVIDTTRRGILTRNHSGQHILSAAFYEGMGIDTTRAELGIKESQIDLEKKVGLEDVKMALNLATKVITEDLPFESKVITPDQLGRYNLRGNLDKAITKGYVRLVQIGTDDNVYDLNACGGTHVNSAGSVLAIALRKLEGRKIRFVCGLEALQHLQNLSFASHDAMRKLGTNLEKYLDDLNSILEERKLLGRSLQKVRQHNVLLRYKVAELLQVNNIDVKILVDVDGDRSSVIALADHINEHEVVICHLLNNQIIIVGGNIVNSQIIFGKLRDAGMKGGGKGKILMGKVKNKSELEDFLDHL